MSAAAAPIVRFAAPVIRSKAILAAGAILALAAGVVTFGTHEQVNAASVRVQIPPSRAEALVRMTTSAGPASMQAVGEQAKLLNASLPFSRSPIEAAQPFATGASSTDYQRALLCLTQAVYYEAGYEPVAGRRAVAQVVLNRLRHPAFPKSLCGVVYQGASSGVCQFTFVCDGALYRAPSPVVWRDAELIARAALAGYVERSVGEATHYHADYVSPRWAPMLAKVVQIGQHIFYRWPGEWGQPAAFTGRYVGEPLDPRSMRPALRVEIADTGTPSNVTALADGPPVARAPNDVGGLLDTSKGWTLQIPDPVESGSAAAQVMAKQQSQPAGAGTTLADAGPLPLAASHSGK
jgi:spore germination cell wall hydrolase CwlJ-like protein